MSETTNKMWKGAVTGVVLFLGLTGVVLVTFLHLFAPERPAKRIPPYNGYDGEPMAEAMTVANVTRELDAVRAQGSRFLGQPGCDATARQIRRAYEDAGLLVLSYPEKIAVPRTRLREILDERGDPLPNVEIYPFLPNHFQPVTTPAEGVSGELVLVSEALLLERPTFTNCIALIDADSAPSAYRFNWSKYAQLGFKAVILSHREGLEQVKWSATKVMMSPMPINFPRLAATPGIFAQVGRTLTVRVHCTWENQEQTTVVGILSSAEPRAEAVVLTTCYDACSPLPDHAPGTLGAVGVAAHLSMLKGAQAFRDDPMRKRDLIFVAYASQMMANFAADRFTSVLGPALNKEEGRLALQADQRRNEEESAAVAACASALRQPGFLLDAATTVSAARALDADGRDRLDEEVRFAMNSLVFEKSEDVLQAELAFVRAGEDTHSAEFAAYRAAKKRYDDVLSVAGFPIEKLVLRGALVEEYGVRNRLQKRFEELVKYHQWCANRLTRAQGINEALHRYDRLVSFGSYLLPADPEKTKGEEFSILMGADVEGESYVQYPVINDVMQNILQRTELAAGVRYASLQGKNHAGWVAQRTASLPVDVEFWNKKGYPGFVILNTDRSDSYENFGSPVELPYMRDLSSVKESLNIAGQTVLALAYGDGRFKKPEKSQFLNSYSGRVYVGGVGSSMVPNYPLAHALLGHRIGDWQFGGMGIGYTRFFFHFADPYGRYDLRFVAADFGFMNNGYEPDAVAFGKDGMISLMKDQGKQGQNVYKSMGLRERGNVNIVVFRATPVTVLDLINPQSLKAYTGVQCLTKAGLTPIDKFNVYMGAGSYTVFMAPDQRFYVTLKAGAPDNELVHETRAFMLGLDPGYEPGPEREIDGPGYLPADTPLLLNIPLHVASSMLFVNQKRLRLQAKHGMADERTQSFHQRSEDLLAESLQEQMSRHAAILKQRDAATYATLNHPVLRESIFEAVVGILWYLGLLVPFVFFFEKLAFGYADIRKQLVAQSIIFLVVFLLLRVLHPAFEMINSSLMILLGFVIMLISGGITVLFSGKFEENLEALKAQRGQVSAAEVNTLGVMGTAFALGLNNMHRRIVRTGLTCATLVLITFAMICFTSVQNDLVDSRTAIGRAAYQGILVKREKLTPISGEELFALQTKYAHRFSVCPRTMLVGSQGWDQINRNPVLEILFEPASGPAKKLPLGSLLTFCEDEPLQANIEMLTPTPWFTKEMVKAAGDVLPVLIPDTLAQALGIRPELVESGDAMVRINGKQVRVHGIFRATSLERLRDLDGRDILPFDVEAMTTIQKVGSSVLAEDTDPRMSADQIVIAPDGFAVKAERAEKRLTSVCIRMPGLKYSDAKDRIDQYLEQSGQATFYGLDGVAYRGRTTREVTFAGMLEMIIPLIIAALTVLNTMRGSVYERRDEIFVYNAVGIAPRYIFGMFFSEAFVYAVVGSVLGYILSQGVGRVLTLAGWTGGINMTFTSINTIYASLAIMGAVFFSTFFPARSAMEIAAPAEESGWTLPDPDGDEMTFDLPFTFGSRDRIAVLAFFARHFVDHGEGSAGKFFAAMPQAGLSDQLDKAGGGGCVPQLATTIWLKPFDLGVSQQLTIAMPTSPETGEYIAQIALRRLSGTRESWTRLNHGFVTLIRRHFLYWRAVSPEERANLFAEARELLEKGVRENDMLAEADLPEGAAQHG